MTRSPIVEDYASSLAELTFNSRPIIDNLTIIAKENTDSAAGILDAIADRIHKCIPEQKLFALYLLDSIVKTVGPPYNVLAGEQIFKLFSHVYLLVGEPTRARLVKIYELWRVTKTKGLGAPLFPPAQLARIGDFLRQAGYKKLDAVLPPEPPAGPTAASLVADIDAILPLLAHKLAANPADAALAGKKAALAELRVLLLSQALLPGELAGIQARLAPMKVPGAAPGPAAPPVAAPVPRAAALFSELVASGLVAVDQALVRGAVPEYTLVLPKHKHTPGKHGRRAASALERLLADANLTHKSQYEQIKYKELVKVLQWIAGAGAARDLQRFVTQAELEAATVQVLYETKALKCAQCGRRFTADAAGAARKRTHLDWHFRINQKQANFKSNVQLRSWYLDDYAWVQFRDDDLLEYEAAPRPERREPVPEAPAAEAYVVIPSTESNTSNMCTVCREQVKPTYKDALGEWVWDACMAVPGAAGKIVHVSCFEEASRKRGAPDDGDRLLKRERLY
ncbi:hypothetical protein METBIDRAFT_11457 [Metschnikowia bicuspidata var. bicuspidata NRRL YB-4993]|uniref:CID domain-containing protein n=1 Tax=Metschnikowia bicuspidata var. bicuspidata NRRL YB-4993 TaxID=869754 RepID=A0A1A0HAD9_9ASCO|nr:hypothetical protein METBIDRAFT_11457 [Metschnikowia bicuspidata var. bicuspidata NRRL YB-4993]OBA20842.1 hypothetical protein METBIDRAFT_11457 [Metschnikowia bicuspidata var. bicuspidata NRRL YB-4993]